MRACIFLLIFPFLAAGTISAQSVFQNPGFELKGSINSAPAGWFIGGSGGYLVAHDSATCKSGKRSVRIEVSGKGMSQQNFGCIMQYIPAKYKGRTLELKAWMKYEEIENGFVGLLLRIDGRDSVLFFDNMYAEGLHGSSDWKLFTISAEYPENAESISFGALHTGSGKLWVDDFQLLLDGKGFQKLEADYSKSIRTVIKNMSREDRIISAERPMSPEQVKEREWVIWECEQLSKAPAKEVQAHPSAPFFPGEVAVSAPRITRSVAFRHSPVPANVRHITDNLYASERDKETMYSTGLYAAPGEIITVEVPGQLQGKVKLQIGCHTDDLTSGWATKGYWRRMPRITREDELNRSTVRVASAFGGLVYLTCSPYAPECSGEVVIRNAVAAPRFVLGQTTPGEWHDMVANSGAPWGEIEGKEIILTCSASTLRKIDNPALQLQIWDNVINACYDLAQIPTPFFRKQRVVTDIQISIGYMHSGYPVMGTHYPAESMVCEDIIAQADMLLHPTKDYSGWGFFHEIGHNMQNIKDWVFQGSGEVSVNFFALYICDRLVGGRDNSHPCVQSEETQKMMGKFFADGAKFDDWQQNPFLGLIMFRQIQADFGWEAFKAMFRRFHEENAKDNRIYSNQEKVDNFVLYLSDATQRNLMPFFKAWSIPVSEKHSEYLKKYAGWMPFHFPPKF